MSDALLVLKLMAHLGIQTPSRKLDLRRGNIIFSLCVFVSLSLSLSFTHTHTNTKAQAHTQTLTNPDLANMHCGTVAVCLCFELSSLIFSLFRRRVRTESCNASSSKACREKLRRDRLNDKYILPFPSYLFYLYYF